ncbi:interferon-stimulated 20 kDa exonuclease-like 2 [Asterias rubens]|uniref:interferon-stimulated 20 kDa exonuclease-like 2 n=1 Tax=Asterias rubens TaxID=7604 RepID=UPI001455839F|nr:interferon-stimulated 20 kDa exonuclease-like 2 [Asterias rubens]XP_033624275.1 interferon-stimulated 20 kDa exonuclease-like 2 [Asterias rubens]
MPAVKRKQPPQSGQSDQNGSVSKKMKNGAQSLKQSKRRSKKNKRKKARQKKKMNLPSRLSRIINYGAKKAQTLLTQRNATIRCPGNGDTTKGTKSKTNGDVKPLLASRSSSISPHESRFERGIPKDRLISLDCEMVGVGPQGRISALARCSIVDYNCNVLYDAYIKPELEILDYRTPWSGIRKQDMEDATPFKKAQPLIQGILDGKILCGHSIRFDLAVLQMGHPKEDIRDTSMYRGLQELAGLTLRTGQHPGLKKLTKLLFGHSIQSGEHCSVEDAKATMNLYKLVENQWEEERISVFPERDFRLSFMDDHYWPDDLE